MTVIYHGEDYSARSGQNDTGTRSYTRVFKLETTEKTEDVFAVGSHASLPAIGSVYGYTTQDGIFIPRDPYAYCTSLSVACVGGWKQWTVTAQYKVTTGKENEPPEEDPEDDAPVITFSSEIYQEPVFRDIDGKGVMNSAGDYFADPSPMRDAAHLIIKVKRNYKTAPAFCLSYQNSINESAFTIAGLTIAKQLARVSRFELSEVKLRGDYQYRELSFELHVHRDGWRPQILNAGLMQKDPDDANKRIPCEDGDGQPVTSPVALDEDGFQLENPSPSTAEFLEFQIYPEVDFSVLPGVS